MTDKKEQASPQKQAKNLVSSLVSPPPEMFWSNAIAWSGSVTVVLTLSANELVTNGFALFLLFFICFILIRQVMFRLTLNRAEREQVNADLIRRNEIASTVRADKISKKNQFVVDFSLTDGITLLGIVTIERQHMYVRFSDGRQFSHGLENIDTVEIIGDMGADLKVGTSGVVLGGLVFGPLGAVAGASLGAMLRKVSFKIKLIDGETFVCSALKDRLETFRTYLSAFQASHRVMPS